MAAIAPDVRQGTGGARLDSSACLAGIVGLASYTGFPLSGCLSARPAPAPTVWASERSKSKSVGETIADLKDIELDFGRSVSVVVSEGLGVAAAESEPIEPTSDSKTPVSPSSALRADLASIFMALQVMMVSARVQSSATIAVLIPHGFPQPSEKSISRYGLRHPPDARGWFPLADGSALGMLQLRPKEVNAVRDDGDSVFSGFSGHSGRGDQGQAQALCLVRLRVVGLLAEHLSDGRHLLELWRVSLRDCHAVLSQMIPGLRAWPVHDDQVRREVLFKIARERFTSLRNILRIDRGRRYLDVVRMHFGEEVAFLFAWQAHYLTALAWLALVTVPFMVVQGGPLWEMWGASYDMLTHTMLTVLFGVAVTELWPMQADRKVHRWHAQSECLSRWHMLVLRILESKTRRTLRLSQSGSRLVLMPEMPLKVDLSFGRRNSDPGGRRNADPRISRQTSEPRLSRRNSEPRVGRETSGEPRVGARPSSKSEASNMAARRSSKRSSNATLEEEAREACDAVLSSVRTGAGSKRSSWIPRKACLVFLMVPILLAQWALILVFFNFTVWFEIWVIFDWGGCRELNEQLGEWKCLAADERRGMIGLVVGALPSICEGVFFELLLAMSRATANWFIFLYDFPTSEGRDFAFVTVVFILEVMGKVGFILTLALAFVPVWDERDANGCASFWDHSILGKYSLACLKGQVPYRVRLNMLRSAMKGPMLVSGLVGIGIKTLLPLLLESWRRGSAPEAPRSCCLCCCRRRVGRCLLAPADFVLRVLLFIFQADHEVVGGFRMFCEWPPALKVSGPQPGACGCLGRLSKTESAKMARQARLWRVLLEGQRREFDPFNEYIEVLLHFLWTACFAIVWPMGCAFALLNQFLEYRFDGLKLLSVRRRRFPSTRHMSVAWVPRFARVVCHIGIFVNVAILMLPYRIASHLSAGSEAVENMELIAPILSRAEWPRISIMFLMLWAFLVSLRATCSWLVRKAVVHLDRGRHTRSVLHKDREAEAVRNEQGLLRDALDGIEPKP